MPKLTLPWSDAALSQAAIGAAGVASGLVLGVLGYRFVKKAALALSSNSKHGSWSKINSPTAGARMEVELAEGKHEIQLYSMATPNGQKITMALEEMGLPYDAHYINILEGAQFGSGFVKINPNSKIPAMVDLKGPGDKPLKLFESGSILLYLAEKSGKLIPKDPALKAECINWLFFQVGAGPFFGQLSHFKNYAPKGFFYDHEYSLNRYATETLRILDVLDKHLQGKTYIVAEEMTIADCAWFPWINIMPKLFPAEIADKFLEFKNIQAWLQRIHKRPATELGLKVNSKDMPNYSSK